MSHSHSPYAVNQAEPVVWKPHEGYAAAAFTGISLWLVVDTSVCILRVFKKKRGLYFWSILLGISGCAIDALGIILRFFVPGIEGPVWPLYTLCLVGGWSLYAPAQLMVLYSRLHLVNDVPWVQRTIFWMILSTLITFVLPTWVGAFHSFNPDHRVSSLWSPRELIIERYTQIGFTICECIVSGTYIWSLLKLLREKAAIRQKRVMTDLIYVNILALCFDIMTVTFVYLNQGGVSHPIQNFSYSLKLKLEFLVLNQLMAVAAHGVLKKSWEEKRYFHTGATNNFSNECNKWAEDLKTPHNISNSIHSTPQSTHEQTPSQLPPQLAHDHLAKPTPSQRSSIHALPEMTIDATAQEPLNFAQSPKPELLTFFEDTHSPRPPEISHPPEPPHLPAPAKKPSDTSGYSGSTLRIPSSNDPAIHNAQTPSPHYLLARPLEQQRRRTTQTVNQSMRRRPYRQLQGSLASPVNATFRRPQRGKGGRGAGGMGWSGEGGKDGKGKGDGEEEEDERMEVHLWERSGNGVLHAPWFRDSRVGV